MILDYEGVLRWAVREFGIQSVSITALVVLIGVVVIASKLTTVFYAGSKVATAGSKVSSGVNNLRWLALFMVALAVTGIISFNPETAGRYWSTIMSWLPSIDVFDPLADLLGGII